MLASDLTSERRKVDANVDRKRKWKAESGWERDDVDDDDDAIFAGNAWGAFSNRL